MKKILILISLTSLASCTPPMKSEPNKCTCTPEHCCADTVTVKENFSPYPELQMEENIIFNEPFPTHHYEEIPDNNEEIL